MLRFMTKRPNKADYARAQVMVAENHMYVDYLKGKLRKPKTDRQLTWLLACFIAEPID